MLSMIQGMMSLVVMCTTSQPHSHILFMGEVIDMPESRGVFGRKQDAEEDAAQQALCEIEQQLQKHPVTTSRGGAVGNHYKSLLKERHCDERQLPAPQYTTEITSGGFVSTVNVPQYKPVRGAVGGSKKEAEQLAAMEALRKLNLKF